MSDNKDDGTATEMDMTPMIDVTFLMIIFFMVVSEISQQDLADVQLPEASEGRTDNPAPPDRLVLNVVAEPGTPGVVDRAVDGLFVVSGRMFDYMHSEEDRNAFRRLLRQSAGEDWNPNASRSERQVLIRCDRRVKYQSVQMLQMLCSTDPRIAVYRLQLAIKKD